MSAGCCDVLATGVCELTTGDRGKIAGEKEITGENREKRMCKGR